MSDICIFDSRNFVFRMHYSHKLLATTKGVPTSVLYGGLDGLLLIAKHLPDTALVFVWDGGGETWRHRFTKGTYKANRTPNPDFEVIRKQMDLFRAFLEKIGIRNFSIPGLEGDDLVGILSHSALKCKGVDKVIICSSDRDYHQLLTDRRVMLGEMGKTTEFLGPEYVQDKYEVTPEIWTLYRALTGDKGDNIIQAKRGIGPKTALKLLDMNVDARVDKFEKLSWQTQHLCPYLKELWPKIHENYWLSRIIEDYKDPLLSDDVRKVLESWEVITGPTVDCFTADKEKRTDKTYQEMVSFLAEYEMEEVLGRRQELFQLP